MTKIAFLGLMILASSPAFAGSDHYGSVVETRTTATDLTFTGSISRPDLNRPKVMPEASGEAQSDQSWPDFNRGPWGN